MNCKPGDLAIMIRTLLPENIGKIVEVLEPLGDDAGLGFRWKVKILSPCRTMSVIDFQSISYGMTTGGVPDAWLRPVSGLPITDDVTDEVTA